MANLVKSEWPTSGSGPLLGLLASIEQQLGAEPSLEWLATGLRKAGGPRSPLNRFLPLLWLREYARSCGVQLGVKRLQALAACASPDGGSDSASLARYFRRYPRLVGYVRASVHASRS